jgi:hypothetical protein
MQMLLKSCSYNDFIHRVVATKSSYKGFPVNRDESAKNSGIKIIKKVFQLSHNSLEEQTKRFEMFNESF